MHPYLELGYISHVPLEQDYRAQSIVTDQGLDLRTGRQAMEANGEKLTRSSVYIPFPVSLVFSLTCPTFFRRSEDCIV